MTTLRAALGALAVLLAAAPVLAGVPSDYSPMVIAPRGPPAHREFDLSAALQRSRHEKKPLYVYLGASDCRYCRRYEAFLATNARELVPHFSGYIVVDLRSELSVQADTLYFRIGTTSRAYADFQRAIGDQRARLLVYPSVWLLDANARPLMQMPAGTGTFETVPEQLEILNLVQ
ncbi:thioredoxin family protein [Ideonella sp.]|uniref:thioredoxin family protein n=1 Tax=Ideonella sp. TaxID=1929293 RepID=UPI002B485ABF|nr:thioredoxin family protein [Ideonella sp.]HJV72106.1 thioredoxin family protein [Ideonella sp.]